MVKLTIELIYDLIMMKHKHNGKARLKALTALILEQVTGHRTSFEISDIKADGTVFVRFRSSPVDPASFLVGEFTSFLEARGVTYTRPDDTRFRFAIDELAV